MKRRRTGHASSPASSSIASSNAYLQFLNHRQNRWMQTATTANTAANASTEDDESEQSSTAQKSATSAESVERNLRNSALTSQTLPSASSSSIAQTRVEARPQEQERSGSVADAMHASSTVPYETISLSGGGMGMAAPMLNTRKSMDSAATARTLPSPAPSDENTNSPTFGEGQIPGRGVRPSISRAHTQGSAPAKSTLMPSNRPSVGTMPEQLMYTGYPQQDQTQQNGSNVQQQQWAMPSPQLPQNHQSRSRPGSMHILPSNGLGSPSTQPQLSPPLPGSARNVQPHQHVVYTASRLPVPQLLQQLDGQREILSRNGQMGNTESGRLALLRDAVVRHDWFYQMLSQIFCLHSVAPEMVPHVLRQVTPQAYTIIGSLLCSNDKVHPNLLKFFSNFPEPIMTIYSDTSNAREVYEGRLRSIALFLQKLPVHWDNLVMSCKNMLAPPLVQDMVELLNMQSEIMQTTAYRAINRMIWGIEDNAGMKVLEEIHGIDQQNYYRYGFRRNPQEKQWAYRMMSFVYEQWQTYRQVCRPDQLNNFTMPFQVRECFGKRPRSIALAPQQQPAQPQQQQNPPTQQPNQNQHQLPLSGYHMPDQAQTPAHVRAFRAQAEAQRQSNHQPVQPPQSNRPQQVPMAMARAMSRPTPTTPGGNSAKRLYPPETSGQRPQPTHPNSDISALHQAHLRSPKLQPQTVEGQESQTLFRHVIAYGLPPTQIKTSTPVQTVEFTVSPSAMTRVARSKKSGRAGEPPVRVVNESSIMYRLRCCTIPPSGYTDESSWITSDNFWPDGLSFSFNNIQLETRRKLHHGRYLAIDVTDIIQPHTNRLRIALNRKDGAPIKAKYALAIEAIGITTRSAITTSLTRIPTATTLESIKKSLTAANASDDDIAVTSSSTSINLLDPYTQSNIVETPVRGSACLHRDCFDLKTFLDFCKRTEPGAETTVVDCWRCPLCRGDVRPQMLVLDEFLVGVRAVLLEKGLPKTRAIQVQADGKWRPKAEDVTGVRSASLEREEQAKMKKSAPIEIIELD